MQAFNELRRAARDRRDKLILKARTEYEATLAKIAGIEQDILGRELSDHRSVMSCVESVMPTDGPFTSSDIVRSLEALDSRRPWRKRTVDHCISRLRSKGLVRRLSKAKAGNAECISPALYVRVGVKADSSPFGDTPLLDVLYEVLQGRALTATELTVAVLEAGYRTAMKPKALRDHAARAMRGDRRFVAEGERWSC
jgi:predicted transcriptional regulator